MTKSVIQPPVYPHLPLKVVIFADDTFKASCSCGYYAWGNSKKGVVRERNRHISKKSKIRRQSRIEQQGGMA